jgi:ParB/RepB/Spo0J family partition protein
MADAVLKTIPLKDIRENPVALRSVNRQSEEYLGLVDSIRRNGILNPILVREIRDPETGSLVYGLIDGLHRYSGAQDAGLTEVPAQVRSMEDGEVLEAQILANIHKVETRPVEYAKQLTRILAQNPTMTASELASRLSKSPAWLSDRLGLTKLDEAIAKEVDDGKINLSNAYALAKLPKEEQANFFDRAMTMTPQEFVPTVTARVKELRDLKRQGKDTTPAGFVPVPHVRKIAELKDELEKPTVGPVLVSELGVKNPSDAFALGVKWALHMDPASIEAARQKDEARKKELAEAKGKRERERLEKQAKDAADKAADLQGKLAGTLSPAGQPK